MPALLGIELYPELILALAALLTAIAGVLSALGGTTAHESEHEKTAEQECLERVRIAYSETEGMAKELHDLRTKWQHG